MPDVVEMPVATAREHTDRVVLQQALLASVGKQFGALHAVFEGDAGSAFADEQNVWGLLHRQALDRSSVDDILERGDRPKQPSSSIRIALSAR